MPITRSSLHKLIKTWLTSTVSVVGRGTGVCSRSATRLPGPLKVVVAVLGQTAQTAVKVAVHNHVCQEIELINSFVYSCGVYLDYLSTAALLVLRKTCHIIRCSRFNPCPAGWIRSSQVSSFFDVNSSLVWSLAWILSIL